MVWFIHAFLLHKSRNNTNAARGNTITPTDVETGKFLEVRRIFAWISSNLPENLLGPFLCERFLKQTIFGGYLQNKGLNMILQMLGAIFSQISTDFQKFSSDFHQIPCNPASYTTDITEAHKSILCWWYIIHKSIFNPNIYIQEKRQKNARFMDDALKTRGIEHWNVETVVVCPLPWNILAMRLH